MTSRQHASTRRPPVAPDLPATSRDDAPSHARPSPKCSIMPRQNRSREPSRAAQGRPLATSRESRDRRHERRQSGPSPARVDCRAKCESPDRHAPTETRAAGRARVAGKRPVDLQRRSPDLSRVSERQIAHERMVALTRRRLHRPTPQALGPAETPTPTRPLPRTPPATRPGAHRRAPANSTPRRTSVTWLVQHSPTMLHQEPSQPRRQTRAAVAWDRGPAASTTSYHSSSSAELGKRGQGPSAAGGTILVGRLQPATALIPRSRAPTTARSGDTPNSDPQRSPTPAADHAPGHAPGSDSRRVSSGAYRESRSKLQASFVHDTSLLRLHPLLKHHAQYSSLGPSHPARVRRVHLYKSSSFIGRHGDAGRRRFAGIRDLSFIRGVAQLRGGSDSSGDSSRPRAADAKESRSMNSLCGRLRRHDHLHLERLVTPNLRTDVKTPATRDGTSASGSGPFRLQ
jgi:hypothetical protein